MDSNGIRVEDRKCTLSQQTRTVVGFCRLDTSLAVVAAGSVNNVSVEDSTSPYLVFCSYHYMEGRGGE